MWNFLPEICLLKNVGLLQENRREFILLVREPSSGLIWHTPPLHHQLSDIVLLKLICFWCLNKFIWHCFYFHWTKKYIWPSTKRNNVNIVRAGPWQGFSHFPMIQFYERALFSPEEIVCDWLKTDTQPERTQGERPIQARADTHLL